MQLLPWEKIDTVLLDMDGTLLDLHFDNHFWLDYLPQCYAEKNGLSRAAADAYLQPLFASYSGQLNWYCVEFWSKTLDLPIKQMKRDTAHLIDLRANADDFLAALKQAGKHTVLVTNAHRFGTASASRLTTSLSAVYLLMTAFQCCAAPSVMVLAICVQYCNRTAKAQIKTVKSLLLPLTYSA